MDSETNYCKNCGHITHSAYCANCGQRSSVHKVTMRETFEDLADNLFSLSAPIVITIKSLITDPGKLLREYLEGKRKKYYKPISFFILTTAVYLFLRWSIGFDIRESINMNEASVQPVDASKINQASYFFFQNINSLAFFLVFTMSLALKIFFYRKYSLVEYVAVAFYLNGVYSLLATINTFYMKFINPEVQYLAILAMVIYFVYAMIRFLRKKPWLVLVKSVIAFFLSYVGYFILAFGFSYLIVLLRN